MVVQPTDMMGVHLGVRKDHGTSAWEDRKNVWLELQILLKITQLAGSGGWGREACLLPPRSVVGLFLYHSLSKGLDGIKAFSVYFFLCQFVFMDKWHSNNNKGNWERAKKITKQYLPKHPKHIICIHLFLFLFSFWSVCVHAYFYIILGLAYRLFCILLLLYYKNFLSCYIIFIMSILTAASYSIKWISHN